VETSVLVGLLGVGGLLNFASSSSWERFGWGPFTLVCSFSPLSSRGVACPPSDPNDGKPTAQARQFARDVSEMPAVFSRAAKLTSLGDRPLAVVTAGEGSQAGWAKQQARLATLSSNSVHRTIAGSTHTSLVAEQHDATQSSRAIGDVVQALALSRHEDTTTR
jgi:hypothetical protein